MPRGMGAGVRVARSPLKSHEKRGSMIDLLLKNKEWLFEQVENENIRQLKKWGVQDHSPFEWLTILTEEVGELASEISELEDRNGTHREVVAEAIQVATLALKIAEMYKFENNKRRPRPRPVNQGRSG
jgi:NTP pyrophosphatase (non-canonical NTP hydrolase)